MTRKTDSHHDPQKLISYIQKLFKLTCYVNFPGRCEQASIYPRQGADDKSKKQSTSV